MGDEQVSNDLPDLLTTVETAAIYRVARSTVTGWAHRGLLPHTRTPTGQLRFHRDTVLRLLVERQPPTDNAPTDRI
jgi:excisionase family DNA binding protein